MWFYLYIHIFIVCKILFCILFPGCYVMHVVLWHVMTPGINELELLLVELCFVEPPETRPVT